MRENKWKKRDRARKKKKHGMRVTGKGYVHIVNRLRKKRRKNERPTDTT
jgi:hypothetical protein